MRKIVKLFLMALGVIVVLIAALCGYVLMDTKPRANVADLQPQLKTLTPQSAQVTGVKLYTQPDGTSCAVTTVATVASFVQKQNLTPEALIAKYKLTGGAGAQQFADMLAQEMPGYQVTYRQQLSDFALIQTIDSQLAGGLPVPILFGAANPYNKPYYDFHASVVTGLDIANEQVDILNVYGYAEQLTLAEFLNRMSYRPAGNYPFIQRAVVRLGLQPKNALLVIAPK